MVNVLNFFDESGAEEHPLLALTAEQKTNASIAAILHDIGKSGPFKATQGEQEAVIQLFSIEGIKVPSHSVGEVVAERFGKNQGEEMLKKLAGCGIDSKMSMREFWNKHAEWTYEILTAHPKGINDHIRNIAGSHHLDNGVNPRLRPKAKTSLQPSNIETLGDEVDDLTVRILMVVDKYQAVLRRGGAKHEAAIAWVRQNLAKYKEDDSLLS